MNIYLRLTSSKIAAYFIILCSAIYGLLYEGGSTMISGFTIGAGIIVNKQYQDRKEFLKDVNK